MADRIILINKPYKWTSFDVVKKLRKPLLDEKKKDYKVEKADEVKRLKVGHAGTLDPLATGLLVICSGKLTRQIQQIQDAEKEYTGTIVLGAVTESYDLETPPKDFADYSHLTSEQILEQVNKFCGPQMQIPPAHSAKKIEGQRAYDKARKGEVFEMKPTSVVINKFEITGINLPEINFRIVCSKGTYIRSIAHDLGQRLGVGGYLSALCRTRIGNYNLSEAVSPDDFLLQLSEKQILPS